MGSITEFSSFNNPPADCKMVTSAMALLKGIGGDFRDWRVHQKMMKPPSAFIKSLKEYDKDNIPPKIIKKLKTPEFLLNPAFTVENIMKKSSACAMLCRWIIALVKYAELLEKYNASVNN